jgi:hypothetical protein
MDAKVLGIVDGAADDESYPRTAEGVVTMKETLARNRAAETDVRAGALTQEQLDTPACTNRFGFWYADFHRWERVAPPERYGDGVAYYQCARCFDRSASQVYRGMFSVQDWDWLKGREFGHTINRLPKSDGPRSVVPPPRSRETVSDV